MPSMRTFGDGAVTVFEGSGPKGRGVAPAADLDLTRTCLVALRDEAVAAGIPNSYIRTIDAAKAAVDAIEKARNL